MEQIIYKIEQFEGPLDLLLSLLAKNKMSIEDIQISIIFDQYMDYIKTMQALDIELSSEFIVMASQLMLIKSRKLLPRVEDDEEDPVEELQRRLLEYERIKETSGELKGLYSKYFGRMEKDTDEISPDRTYVADHDVNLLTSAFMHVLSNIEITDEVASEKIKPLISTRTVSVGERVYAVLRILVINNGRVNVIDCFSGVHTKHEAVATFMALLEMLKAGRITISEIDELYAQDQIVDLNKNVYIDLYTGKIKIDSEENNGY